MINKKDIFINFVVIIIANVFSGIILYILTNRKFLNINIAYILFGIVFVVIQIIAFYKLVTKCNRCTSFKIKDFGVINILDSMIDGQGSTVEIIKKVKNKFWFMGISARKWLDEQGIIDKFKHIGFTDEPDCIKLLILDPHSDGIQKIAQAQKKDPLEIKNDILKTIKECSSMKKNKLNIEIKLYNFLPTFRIALIDEKLMYLGFYSSVSDGRNSKQIVINQISEINSLFKSFKEYIWHIWNNINTKRVDLESCFDLSEDEIEKKLYS